MNKLLYTKVFTKHEIEIWIDTREIYLPTIGWNRRLHYFTIVILCIEFNYYY